MTVFKTKNKQTKVTLIWVQLSNELLVSILTSDVHKQPGIEIALNLDIKTCGYASLI